jgi:dynactin 1
VTVLTCFQLEALRGTVRFLRTENSYLKGQDMLREIEALPPLPAPAKRPDTPPLEPSVLADADSDADDGPRTPPTLRALATETKRLYRDALRFAAAPRVVDLSAVNARRVEAAAGGPAWMSRKQMPAQQMLARKAEAERLRNRVRGLVQRTNVLDR